MPIASPLPSEGSTENVAAEASDMQAWMISWSRSLLMRNANTVLHCDRMVASSSDGR